MNCLLVAATAKEIAPFIGYYRDAQKLVHIDMNIDVLITGIGMTSSAYHLTKQLHLKRPDLVIQAGIAGCYDKKLPLGTVVTVKQDRIADEIVLEGKKLKTLFGLGLLHANQPPYKTGWLINPGTALLKRSRLKAVKGISVNQVTTDRKMAQLYEKHFSPVTETMEGAALHYVCLMEKVAFLQIRSISNYIGERNKKNWNLKGSVSNLNHELARLLESL